MLLQKSQSFGLDVVYNSRHFYVICCNVVTTMVIHTNIGMHDISPSGPLHIGYIGA